MIMTNEVVFFLPTDYFLAHMTKKPHGWYKEITIRPVVNVEGYEIYEKVCSYVADIFFFTIKGNS